MEARLRAQLLELQEAAVRQEEQRLLLQVRRWRRVVEGEGVPEASGFRVI